MARLLCRGLSALAKPAGEKGRVSLAAAGLLYPWRQSSQPPSVSGRRLWWLHRSPPPRAHTTRRQPLAELLAELAALGLGSPGEPGWQLVCSPQGGETCLCCQVPQHLSHLILFPLHPSPLGWSPREKGCSRGSPDTSAARGSPRSTTLVCLGAARTCRSSCSPCPKVSPGFRQRRGAQQPQESSYLWPAICPTAALETAPRQRNTAPLGGNCETEPGLESTRKHLPIPGQREGHRTAPGSPQVAPRCCGVRMGIAAGAVLANHGPLRAAAVKAIERRRLQLCTGRDDTPQEAQA